MKIAFTSHQSHLLHPKYRRDIDGLRALAVLSVVFYHAFPDILHGGFVGVDIFFVISGFLISTIIFENLENNTFSFFEFYARRIRRIFPALILVLTLCLIFGWFALLSDLDSRKKCNWVERFVKHLVRCFVSKSLSGAIIKNSLDFGKFRITDG